MQADRERRERWMQTGRERCGATAGCGARSGGGEDGSKGHAARGAEGRSSSQCRLPGVGRQAVGQGIKGSPRKSWQSQILCATR